MNEQSQMDVSKHTQDNINYEDFNYEFGNVDISGK